MSFCSRAALASHEATAGTGVRATAYVFLPVPKRFWREEAFNDSWASSAELEALKAARRGGVVGRLYNPPDPKQADACQALVFLPRGRTAPAALEPLLEAISGRFRIDHTPSPRLAVCTHGQRDRCCAKWGFAVYTRARRLYAEGALRFEPLESSHLGGDRFAATGIFFPSGSMYAHLDAIDLAELASREMAGRIGPEGYRGRVFEGPTTQIVRAGLARAGLFDAAESRLAIEGEAADGAALTASADGRRFSVELAEREIGFFSDCEALHKGRRARARRLVVSAVAEL